MSKMLQSNRRQLPFPPQRIQLVPRISRAFLEGLFLDVAGRPLAPQSGGLIPVALVRGRIHQQANDG